MMTFNNRYLTSSTLRTTF